MSEYQYVAFRAIDRAVSEKNLAYMRQQSSRAEITPWSFENEYHYGDFHGNALEMLRRGYDIHLHYANFGTRTLLIRLPDGFPDAWAAKPYLDGESLRLVNDKNGPGGTLAIEPYYEPDDLDELWDRTKYLIDSSRCGRRFSTATCGPFTWPIWPWPATTTHDPEETVETPVPSGLREPTDAQLALAEFYGISETLVAAAARESGPLPTVADQRTRYAEWLAGSPRQRRMRGLPNYSATRARRYDRKSGRSLRKSRPSSHGRRSKRGEPSPSSKPSRGRFSTTGSRRLWPRRRANERNASRRWRLPRRPSSARPSGLWLERSTDAYEQVSQLLADLREALAGAHSPTWRKSKP